MHGKVFKTKLTVKLYKNKLLGNKKRVYVFKVFRIVCKKNVLWKVQLPCAIMLTNNDFANFTNAYKRA